MSNSALAARRSAAIARGVGISSPLFATRARNAKFWYAEKRRYIGFASGIAVLNTGHGHPRVVEAVKAQIDAFSYACLQGRFGPGPLDRRPDHNGKVAGGRLAAVAHHDRRRGLRGRHGILPDAIRAARKGLFA